MISIRVISRGGEQRVSRREAVFADDGGDIGRGTECTLALPDPERRISRRHLRVARDADGGMTLRLLSANLLVELDGVPMVPGVEMPLAPGARIRLGPFELIVEAVAPPAAPAAPITAPAADDSMALLRPRARASSVFGELLQAPAPAPPSAMVTPSALSEVDLMLGDPTGAGVPAPAPLATEAADPAGADAIAALHAGLGIPAPAVAPGAAARQVELAAALLRECVSGTLGLLAARAIAKRELGAGATQLQTRENNALKFARDVDGALGLLLAPPRPGFVPPLDAVRDAFDDLRAHEVAVLAGMRSALSEVLDRFDPVVLEARFADKGLWDSLLPANRRARLWERYAEQHAAIAREIEEHFDAIFARAFARAYDAQRAALRQGRA
jgi:predicted component of type VI protein secretion system